MDGKHAGGPISQWETSDKVDDSCRPCNSSTEKRRLRVACISRDVLLFSNSNHPVATAEARRSTPRCGELVWGHARPSRHRENLEALGSTPRLSARGTIAHYNGSSLLSDMGVMQFSGNECQLGFDETSKLPSITYSSSSTRLKNGLARAGMHDGKQARYFVKDRINRLEWDYQERGCNNNRVR